MSGSSVRLLFNTSKRLPKAVLVCAGFAKAVGLLNLRYHSHPKDKWRITPDAAITPSQGDLNCCLIRLVSSRWPARWRCSQPVPQVRRPRTHRRVLRTNGIRRICSVRKVRQIHWIPPASRIRRIHRLSPMRQAQPSRRARGFRARRNWRRSLRHAG
jgi:hypothetical protein